VEMKNNPISIRKRLAERGVGNAKLNKEIVADLKGWLEEGLTNREAWARLRGKGFHVELETVRSIRGGRAWATVQPRR